MHKVHRPGLVRSDFRTAVFAGWLGPGHAPLEQGIKEICRARVRYGYRRVHIVLRRDGWRVSELSAERVLQHLRSY